MKPNFTKVCKSLVLTILLVLPIFSFGQLRNNITAKDSVKTGVSAIPVINIVKKIEEANQEIKDTGRRIRVKSNILLIDSLFPSYAEFIRAQKKQEEKFVEANPNREKINNQIKKWNTYGDNLGRWEETISDYVTRNTILLEGIVIKEKTWELTYQKAVEEKVPLEVLSSVKVVWDNYTDISKVISSDINRFLLLETKINKEKSTVNKVIEDLTDLKN